MRSPGDLVDARRNVRRIVRPAQAARADVQALVGRLRALLGIQRVACLFLRGVLSRAGCAEGLAVVGVEIRPLLTPSKLLIPPPRPVKGPVAHRRLANPVGVDSVSLGTVTLQRRAAVEPSPFGAAALGRGILPRATPRARLTVASEALKRVEIEGVPAEVRYALAAALRTCQRRDRMIAVGDDAVPPYLAVAVAVVPTVLPLPPVRGRQISCNCSSAPWLFQLSSEAMASEAPVLQVIGFVEDFPPDPPNPPFVTVLVAPV